MEVKEIKSRLTITQILQHYGLKPDKNNRLLCPFNSPRFSSRPSALAELCGRRRNKVTALAQAYSRGVV
ncbi:MAG: hypothetical protein KF862_24605 [Chitinophagaceae bacterium]|nr:hypothetical protein [Chitinophagaceae bacterium]